MRIYAGVPWRGGQTTVFMIENVDFLGFWTHVFGTLGNEANVIIILVPCRPANDTKYVTLNDLEWPFYVKFSLLRTAL